MDYPRFLSLRPTVSSSSRNGVYHISNKSPFNAALSTGGSMMDGKDADTKTSGSEAITKSLHLIDVDLQNIMSTLRSALEDAQAQLKKSEETCKVLEQENAQLKRALAMVPTAANENAKGPKIDIKKLFINPPPETHLHQNMTVPTTTSRSSTIHSTIEVLPKIKLLNNMISECAEHLGQSIVSVVLPATNTTPVSKDPEWQAALQVSTSRLGKFLTNTLVQESHKLNQPLNFRLIHITLASFFTSLIAEWSGWRLPSTHSKDHSGDDSNINVITTPNRDVETALAEFSNICLIAKWNTNRDWDAAFEKELTSLSHIATIATSLSQHPHGQDPSFQDTTTAMPTEPKRDRQVVLFVLPGSRFNAERMDDVHPQKENEKGVRKTASCVGFGLSLEWAQHGTSHLLVKPRVVLESMLFVMLNPPQPTIQSRPRAGYGNRDSPAHRNPRSYVR